MGNLLEKTGVPQKVAGDGLSHRDINNINSTVNNAIDAINLDLKDYCNVNQEINNFSKVFSLYDAINAVPKSRRRLGLKLRYLSSNSPISYCEYVFCGLSIDDENWSNTNNWTLPFIEVDGGEWEISDEFGLSN